MQDPPVSGRPQSLCVAVKSRELGKRKKKMLQSWALVAHPCNPTYAGGRDQEDRGSKPARPSFEKPFTKIGLGSGSR
jgi:hypothetical protein